MAYNLLKGKRGIIFGALNEQSIAWKVAERAVEEGAQILLTNTPVALRLGAMNKLAEQCGTIIVPADATSVEDLQNLVDKAFSVTYGARNLRRTIQKELEDPISEKIIDSFESPISAITITVQDEQIQINAQ